MEKELRLEMRIRNARLWTAIHKEWPTVAAFCRAHQLSQSEIGSLLNLGRSPIGTRGEYLPTCKKVAAIFGLSTEELFPIRIYKLPTTKAVREMSLRQFTLGENELRSLPAPDDQAEELEAKELHSELLEALSRLPPKHQKTLVMLFGIEGKEHTLMDVALELEVTPSRIRQIRQEALSLLRRSTASRRSLQIFHKP